MNTLFIWDQAELHRVRDPYVQLPKVPNMSSIEHIARSCTSWDFSLPEQVDVFVKIRLRR